MPNIFGNLRSCERGKGNIYVWLGTTGKGKEPNHKIVFDREGSEQLFGAFDTRYNRRFEDVEVGEQDWSHEHTSLTEFKKIFATLPGRTVTRRRKP